MNNPAISLIDIAAIKLFPDFLHLDIYDLDIS